MHMLRLDNIHDFPKVVNSTVFDKQSIIMVVMSYLVFEDHSVSDNMEHCLGACS